QVGVIARVRGAGPGGGAIAGDLRLPRLRVPGTGRQQECGEKQDAGAQDAMGSLEHGHRNEARERPKVPDASRSASPAVAPIPTFPRKRGKESRWRLPPRKRGKEQAQAPSPATRGRAGVGARGIATGTTSLRQLPPSRPSPARGGKEQVV